MAISDRPTERTQRIAAMLAAALALPEQERGAYLDGACTDPTIRREIDALLASIVTTRQDAPERWRRASAVFAVAADLPPAERDAYLDAECGEDASLRAEVDQLLRHGDHAGGFLETPPVIDLPGSAEPKDPLVGRSIGPYLVRGRIGGGGMGVVYLAEHARLNKTVAIKALHDEYARDPNRRERLLREARAAAALSHPNVVTVYGLEEQDDSLYLITEYIRGPNLRASIAGGPLPLKRVLDIALAVAHGLAAAHARDIVHRDLKPDNVMLPDEGGVKIVDFGLARTSLTGAGGPPLTKANERWGTPGYMAPEQLRGMATDFRADLFAFAVLVHELATGRNPFEGPTPEATNANVLVADVPPLSTAAAPEFACLDGIVARCLNKDRNARYESTEALVADLERVRASLWTPTPSPQMVPSPAPRAYHAWQAYEIAVASVCTLVLVALWLSLEWLGPVLGNLLMVIAVAAVAVAGTVRLRSALGRPRHELRSDAERRRNERWLRVADWSYGIALLTAAGRLFGRHDGYATLFLLSGLVLMIAFLVFEPVLGARAFPHLQPRPWKSALSLFAAGVAGAVLAAAVALVSGPPAWLRHAEPSFSYVTFSGRDGSPAVSPDGRFVAFASERDGRRRIWLKQVGSDTEVPLTDGVDDYPRFSPDGRQILFSRLEGPQTSLCTVDAVGGSVQKVLANALYGDWSPDGGRVAFVRAGTTASGSPVSIVGLADADGTNVRGIASFDYGLRHPRWSPDGSTLALVPIAGGTPLSTAPAPPAGAPSEIVLVNVESGRSWTIKAPAPRRALSSVAWNGGSREVIYSQADSVLAAAGSAAHIIRQDVATGAVVDNYWAPERASVLDILGRGRVVFDTRSPRQNLQEITSDGATTHARWLSRGNSTDRQPAVSNDGSRVLFSSNRGGNMAIWMASLQDGRITRLTRAPAGATDWDPAWAGSQVVWSSDRSGNFECWIAEADGSRPRLFTHDGANAENPTASADGQWIVYASGHPQRQGLWRIRADGTGAVQIARGPLTLPHVSRDHGHVVYRERPFGGVVKLGVVSLDGQPVPFEIRIRVLRPTQIAVGRARWMPGGRAIAFVGQHEDGSTGVFVQDFVPGQNTDATRRSAAQVDEETAVESFDVSSDGRRFVVSAWLQLFSLMEGTSLPSVRP